ncbi:methyl-accepting chemotaxis protein [Alteribacillus sp. YIM 98480]|uniref:methyl-accepting chemotaxis protein n=1 Tax=Alteribacillus sp. YIM 98480 TaxID=2606599 RepID=UPI00131B2C1E|nr:methyl-accepting chemotaxis protein [Alteribacillus sp. YIM 98480]
MKSIRAKLIGGFSIILALLLVFTGIVFYFVNDTNSQINQVVEEDFSKISAYKELAYNLTERNSLALSYILTGKLEYRESFDEYSEEARAIEEQLLNMVNDERLDNIVQRSQVFEQRTEEDAFQSYDEGKMKAAESIMSTQLTPLGTYIKNDLQELIEEEQASVDNNAAALNNQAGFISSLSVIIGAGATLLGLVVAVIIANRMSRPIKEVSEKANHLSNGDLTVDHIKIKSKDEIGQLAANFNDMADNLRSLIGSTREAAEQVASTSEQLSASSEETSASTNEISSTIQEVANSSETAMSNSKQSMKAVEQLSGDIEKVSESLNEFTKKSKETEEAAESGNNEIKRSSEQMGIINSEVQETAEIVKQLGDRSTEIGSIIETITNISEQTNLLALNAAIEAARAGEHGKGFAVVADEVRKLAEESKQSADKITSLIETIQEETEKAVEKMSRGQTEAKEGVTVIERAGSAFETILMSVQEIAQHIEDVSGVSSQMSANSAKVFHAVEGMNDVAESTAGNAQNVAAGAEEQLAAMEEVSSSSEELSRMAQELQEEVNKFKI